MKDDEKTREQLVHALTESSSQNAELKKSITGSVSSGLAAEEALRYAESILETVREPLLVLDEDLKIISANRNFFRTFKVIPGETLGCFIYDLGNKQWDIPKLRELLEEVVPEKQAFDDFEVDHYFQDIGHKIMLLNARQIHREDIGTNAKMILLAIEDITERKRLESLLTESEEQFRRLFETASDGIVLLEKNEGRIIHANPAAEKMLGYTQTESIGNKLQDIGILLDEGNFQTTMQHLNKSGIINYDDVPIRTKFGQHIDTDIYLVDRAKLAQCNIRDITKRRQAEKEMQTSLLEKETMLKEIHHRVKNNLQLISSLLSLQSSYLPDEKAKEMFQNSIDRVETMANIHTMLYQSEDLSSVDFGSFIRDLAGRLRQPSGREGSPVEIQVNVSPVSLTIETSIPCGLILNELVSNALKYAFPAGRGGEVNISMAKVGDQFVLKVQDNGIGFPETVDFKKTRSLGLKLVNLLTGQMNGAVGLHVEAGTTFTITFPVVSKKG